MNRAVVLLLTMLAIAVPAAAGDVVPGTNPISYTWIATPCENWTCASSALVIAAGDPYTFALPTSCSKFPWVIVRRVVAGSVYLPPDAAFDVEKFDDADTATARFVSVPPEHAPILVTTVAGTPLVVSLKHPSAQRSHAVKH